MAMRYTGAHALGFSNPKHESDYIGFLPESDLIGEFQRYMESYLDAELAVFVRVILNSIPSPTRDQSPSEIVIRARSGISLSVGILEEHEIVEP